MKASLKFSLHLAIKKYPKKKIYDKMQYKIRGNKILFSNLHPFLGKENRIEVKLFFLIYSCEKAISFSLN